MIHITILYKLIKDGVFDVIFLSFLPVGHTHEDIDQVTSLKIIMNQISM